MDFLNICAFFLSPSLWHQVSESFLNVAMHVEKHPQPHLYLGGFLDDSDGKESACNAGDLGLIPGLGRSPTEGNGYPPQYSCLENFTDRGAWRATVHGVAKSQTQLSDFHIHTLVMFILWVWTNNWHVCTIVVSHRIVSLPPKPPMLYLFMSPSPTSGSHWSFSSALFYLFQNKL